MSDLKLGDYIPRGGEVAWAGPSDFSGATLFGFLVPANPMRVHEMLTRYIGRPSLDLGLHIDVRGTTFDHVLFVFVDSQRRQKLILKGGGRAAHREKLFAILVLGHRHSPDCGPVLFAPYVYVSESPGWRAEREMYGYPQQFGQVRIELGEDQMPETLSLAPSVIRRFKQDAKTAPETIVALRRKRRSEGTRDPAPDLRSWLTHVGTVTSCGHAATSIRQHPRLARTAADMAFFERRRNDLRSSPAANMVNDIDLGTLLSQPLPMVFLKQFRDVVHGDRACYQAIVEASLTVHGGESLAYLNEYELDLTDADSIPIRRELGIPTEEIINVTMAFRLEVGDITMGAAKVVSNPNWNPAGEISTEHEASRLPRYVDRGGEAVWRQPSLLLGSRIYGFGVEVSEEQQAAVLKKFINDVAQKSRRPYGPHQRRFELEPCTGLNMAMLMFVEYQRIISGTDDDSRLGGVSYREFLMMQLAMTTDPELPELNWFIPFLYLDNDSARVSGREIYGYPKQLARIPEFVTYGDRAAPGPAKQLSCKAAAMVRKGAPRATHHTVVRIDRPDLAPPAITRRYNDSQEMFFDVLAQADAGRGGETVRTVSSTIGSAMSQPGGAPALNAAVFANIGNVFLKEFRDCADPTKACYQAVCKTDTVPGRFHGGGRLDPSGYEINIRAFPSEPLLEYLGVPAAAGDEVKIKPRFAYFADLDVELTNGRVIANPCEVNYVPDVSPGSTERVGLRTRTVRRSRERGSLQNTFAEAEGEP